MIAGPSILRLNNGTPINLTGEWNVTVSIPAYYSYGQGDGSPGSGFNGAAKGTAQDVSGSFRFNVDPSATITEAQLYAMQRSREFFTMDWPVGDPLSSQVSAKATHCHWQSLTVNVDAPSGKMEISGSMKAGVLETTQGAPA